MTSRSGCQIQRIGGQIYRLGEPFSVGLYGKADAMHLTLSMRKASFVPLQGRSLYPPEESDIVDKSDRFPCDTMPGKQGYAHSCSPEAVLPGVGLEFSER